MEIFDVLMQDMEYQRNKAEKPVTDLKTIITEEYHKLQDIFSKAVLDKVLLYSKHEHKIIVLYASKDNDHGALWVMSVPQLEFMKQDLEEHLKKILWKQAILTTYHLSYSPKNLVVVSNLAGLLKVELA